MHAPLRRALLVVLLAPGCASETGADDEAGEDSEDDSSEGSADLPAESGEAETGTESEGDSESESDDGGPDCPEPAPAPACTCEPDSLEWICPMAPEAGFVDIPALDYAIALPEGPPSGLSSTAHRQFWAFRPADENPQDAPLFVFFNGGPAVSSGMLLGLNVGPLTFDPASTGGADLAANPHSWTSLGNALWIDARNVGFSYGMIDDPSNQSARSQALAFASFNTYLDAADFVRVLLEFLADHPELADAPVVLVAESYGGLRAQLMLDMLLSGPDYADGDRRLIDPDLAASVAAHHLDRFGVADPPPDVIAEQFGHQVLIQPALTGDVQHQIAGQIFEGPDSPVEALALELGLDFVPCSEQLPPCSPYDNALDFVGDAGRSPYDTRAPGSWLSDLFALVGDRCNDAQVVSELLGVELDAIDGLAPIAREEAWRLVSVDAQPSDAEAGDMDRALGGLAPWDRYFLVFEYGALSRFRGYEAQQLEVDPADPHFGEHLLRNLLWVDTFITAAEYDLVVYTPAIPGALESPHYDSIVAGVEVAPTQWSVEYLPGAFGLAEPGSRTIYVPTYEASHAVTLDAPGEILADVAVWMQ